jgi:reverse gyrase
MSDNHVYWKCNDCGCRHTEAAVNVCAQCNSTNIVKVNIVTDA